MSTDKLNGFSRVKSQDLLTDEQKKDYESNGVYADTVPFTWKANGADGYKTYMDCYNKVLKDKMNNND